MTTGKRMKRIKQEKGLSQKEPGEKIGVSHQMIGQWENGKSTPKIETAQKTAYALNIPHYELMGFDGSIRVNPNKQRPFDIAIQKVQNKETLTYEEFMVLLTFGILVVAILEYVNHKK